MPTPVLQEKEIEVSNGTGYSLNNIQGAETVKALEQGTIVISYKATGENAIQSLFSVGNGMILSILVDTFISKISLTMQPGPKIDSISGA